MTKKATTVPTVIVQPAASFVLQAAVVGLVFTSLAIGVFSSILLIDNSGKISELSDTLHEAVRTRDIRFKAIDDKLRARTDDRYRGADAAADLAQRDEQIDLLWKNIKRLERRR